MPSQQDRYPRGGLSVASRDDRSQPKAQSEATTELGRVADIWRSRDAPHRVTRLRVRGRCIAGYHRRPVLAVSTRERIPLASRSQDVIGLERNSNDGCPNVESFSLARDSPVIPIDAVSANQAVIRCDPDVPRGSCMTFHPAKVTQKNDLKSRTWRKRGFKRLLERVKGIEPSS